MQEKKKKTSASSKFRPVATRSLHTASPLPLDRMGRQYHSAFPRPFRYRFKPETWMCSSEYMLAFWGEKKPADGASTCPPSCSNTRRSDFKTSTSAHAQLGPIQQRVAAHQVILNLMTLYLFFFFTCRAYSQQ